MKQKQVERTFYRDKYNENKIWEVVKLVGGYYLREYIKGKQYGRGVRATKKYIQSIGIFEFEQVEQGELIVSEMHDKYRNKYRR